MSDRTHPLFPASLNPSNATIQRMRPILEDWRTQQDSHAPKWCTAYDLGLAFLHCYRREGYFRKYSTTIFQLGVGGARCLLILGLVMSRIRPSLASHTLGYKAVYAVLLCMRNASLVSCSPFGSTCSKCLQMSRNNATCA